ncbi:MAG: anhydro-N-acetylmuramic acid kinase [Nitrospinae bacterium]|nr:anhydro-N-acetylmuramic acid kinase [Nitrospinota bacterium]
MNDSPSLMAIGLMSGTSADGVDAALVRILPGARAQVETLGFHAAPYPRDLRERLLRAGGEAGALTDEICSLHREVGEAFASAALEVASRSGARLEKIDFIGSHGQTVRHLPEGAEGACGPLLPSTLQIGDPAFIAQRTGITCVSDFRARDVAAGGAGAPLTPWAHRILFGRESAASAFLNLGGISNITYLPPVGAEGVFGFDCGPANMTLDALAQRITNGEKNHDTGGDLAAAGRVCTETLAELRRHPYLKRKPPKSTGRETFGEAFVEQVIERMASRGGGLKDAIATLTAFSASCVADAIRDFLPTDPPLAEVVVGGGGVHNNTLMRRLDDSLGNPSLAKSDARGVSPDAVEAVCFALLAWGTLSGEENNLPSATGAKEAVCLGNITPGRNFASLMRLLLEPA